MRFEGVKYRLLKWYVNYQINCHINFLINRCNLYIKLLKMVPFVSKYSVVLCLS